MPKLREVYLLDLYALESVNAELGPTVESVNFLNPLSLKDLSFVETAKSLKMLSFLRPLNLVDLSPLKNANALEQLSIIGPSKIEDLSLLSDWDGLMAILVGIEPIKDQEHCPLDGVKFFVTSFCENYLTGP